MDFGAPMCPPVYYCAFLPCGTS